jgi:hypothetical protein
MKIKTLVVSSIMFFAGFNPLFADTAVPATVSAAPDNQTQKVIVEIQQKAQEAAKTPVVDQANEWVDFGKHVGQAMREGLSALTDEANKFSGTPAGRFTMAVIAWKVAGHDAIELTNRLVHVVVGIPLLIAWVTIGLWVIRKNFMQHKVVIEKTGFWLWGTKKYQMVNQDSFSEGKGAALIITIIIFVIVSCILMFGIIL